MNTAPDLRIVDQRPIGFQRHGSVEAEQALLGAALLHPTAMELARDLLTEEDFGEPVHRAIWTGMREAADAGSATPGLVVARMGSIGATNLGGQTLSQYIARLAAEATTISNVRQYCEAIRDNADRRRLADSIHGLPETLSSEKPISTIVSRLMGICDAVAARRTASKAGRLSMEQALVKAIDGASEAYRKGGRVTGLSWGVKALDDATGGLHRGEVVLQMGRPSMGKTALAIWTARSAAHAGHPVMFFSLEMTAEKLSTRIISSFCYTSRESIPYFNIDKGRVSEDEFFRITEVSRSIAQMPLVIDPQARISPAQMSARLRRWCAELAHDGMEPGLVVVDYIGLMAASERYSGNRVNEVSELSAGLKALAKEFNVPMLALSQMSRGAESRDDKRPQLSDLRDSGSLEQDADAVIGLYRPAYHLARKANRSEDEDAELRRVLNLLEVSVLKQRSGPVGVHNLFCAIDSNFVGSWQG